MLYFSYISTLLKSKAQYPISFIMLCFATFVASSIDLIGITALFSRFDNLLGWQLEEIAILYGIIKISFALGEGLGRGFDQFYTYVKNGDFDILLLRPRSTILQVAAMDLKIAHIGTFLQGLIVLCWGLFALNVPFSPAHILLSVIATLGGACLFYGLLVIQATLSFWTTETLELMNIITYGGAELGQYPITIYQNWFRRFFTYVIPIACITYFPLLTIVGKEDPLLGTPMWLGWITPFVGLLFLFLSFALWNVGVRHYRSTGS